MKTLEQIQQKYPNVKFNHGPYAECSRCHGEGEYMSRAGQMTFCFCLFVDHEFHDLFQDIHNAFNKIGRDRDRE